MKKQLMIGLAVMLLMTGCQKTTNIEDGSTLEPTVIDTGEVEKVVLDDESEQVSEDMADVLEEAVVSELHEWTEADAADLKVFTSEAEKLTLKEAKMLLDEKIMDASSMMADEYVAYYESRLIRELNQMTDLFFVGTVQEDLSSAFNYGYFSRAQLQEIKAIDTIEKIDPLYDLGYKVETSEGMYYPIVDYSVLYAYEDKVTSGVQQYLRLMKRESDIMAYSDAAVIVPWSELGERLLMAEVLQDAHLPEEMKKRVQDDFKWTFMSFVFGTSNTPVFDFEHRKITDQEIISAFKEVADRGGETVQSIMVPYLEILEQENYEGSDLVYETVNDLLEKQFDY